MTAENPNPPSRVDPEQSAPLDAAAGRLTATGRRAAIDEALALVGTYFERGSRALHVQPGPSRSADAAATDRLLAALRLRLALAAAERLAGLAGDITRRPNFRYERRKDESVGAVRGRLDVTRYITGTQRLQQPPRYPVTTAVRTQATPENTLLVCAAHWLLGELGQTALLTGLPNPGPEREASRTATEEMRGLLALPLFATCRSAAREIMRLERLGGLLDQVDVRITTGRVLNAQPYARLVEWMRDSLSGKPAATAGQLDWSFYGEEFDPKLFELWCLSRLATAIGTMLGHHPAPPDLSRRLTAPMYTWDTPTGLLEIHFQRSPHVYGARFAATWLRVDDGTALAGVPDISVIGRPTQGEQRLVLLDPKLRQRPTGAAEEIYKLLGYFEQYGLHGQGAGALLLYGTDDRVTEYETDQQGRMLETTVDPARSTAQTTRAWAALARLALGAVGLQSLPAPHDAHRDPAREAGEEADEDRAQRLAVFQLAALAQQVGDAALQPWRSQLETAFPGTWAALGEDTQEMCATAVYLGNVLTDGRDFSGPVLGLAAAAEKLLHEHVLGPAARIEPDVATQHMLGQMLEMLRLAVATTNTAPSIAAVRTALGQHHVDQVEMGSVVAGLTTLNRQYRRPAAHRELLPRSTWIDCHRLALVGPEPLLPRLAALVL